MGERPIRMDQLVDRIATAFETNAAPPDRIVVHECLECEEVSRDFAGQRWTELSWDVLESHHDSIPLLSPEAFAYYLPAYLTAAVKDRARFGDVVLYNLAPTADAWSARRRAACQYSGEQLQLILDVAEAIAREDLQYFDRFMRRARAYWASSGVSG